VTNKNTSKSLYALSEIDKKIVVLTNQKTDMESERAGRAAKLKAETARRERTQAEFGHKSSRQAEEEKNLKDAQRKIIERRKQIAAMAGVKAAKFAEREVDIEAKAIQLREEQLLKAMEDVENSSKSLTEVKETVKRLEESDTGAAPEEVRKLAELAERIAKLSEERTALAANIESSAQRLYDRVRTKYPAQPVAVADKGSCGACFRTLPPHDYNEVLADQKLIQCPGCSRILVAAANLPVES
jgi:uncharacterized protein